MLNLLSRPLSDSQFHAGKELQGTNLLKDINNLDYIKIRLSPSFRQHALFTGTLQKPDPLVRVHLWPSYSQIICQTSQDTKKREEGHELILASWSFWVGILALPGELHEGQKHRFCKGYLSLSSLRERAERFQKPTHHRGKWYSQNVMQKNKQNSNDRSGADKL